MPEPHPLPFDLRAATLADIGIVADLEATRDPEDPRDPEMMRFWWTSASLSQVSSRLVAVDGNQAVAFMAASHERWGEAPERFGSLRAVIRSDVWSEREYVRLIGQGERWLGSEGVVDAVNRVREDFSRELEALDRIGYREVRRQNVSELDLVAHRDDLLRGLSEERRKMKEQGVTMLTLSEYKEPNRLVKLYEMMIAAEQDIPVTVPIPTQPFDEWMRATFDDPGVREDRFWIARDGEAIVGLSYMEFPPVRGLPWTAFTATSKKVRGRGIARALKYESMGQAIELGSKRVRTANDGANAPILHINKVMGYRLVTPVIELHRSIPA
ncbi:MAG: GNAT family N-acetyltransferase [Candidatus Dormibacteraceae bacterium]